MILYTVRRGDTLCGIARQYRLPPEMLRYANPHLIGAEQLRPGTVLMVPLPQKPCGNAAVCFCPCADAPISGSAVLSPTWASVITCCVSAGGELLPVGTAAPEQLESCGRLLTVKNLSQSGSFSGSAAHPVLTDGEIQAAFLQNLLAFLDRNALIGVVLEFAYVFPFEREQFRRFLQRLSERLHERGYLLFSVLPPQSGAEQFSLGGAACCNADHGNAADFVILKSADDSLTALRDVLSDAVSEIAHGKILADLSGFTPGLPLRAESVRRAEAALRLAGEFGIAGFCCREPSCLLPPFSCFLTGLYRVESAHS